jgi:hypothetical protein
MVGEPAVWWDHYSHHSACNRLSAVDYILEIQIKLICL